MKLLYSNFWLGLVLTFATISPVFSMQKEEIQDSIGTLSSSVPINPSDRKDKEEQKESSEGVSGVTSVTTNVPSNSYSILLMEESANSLGIYDSSKGTEIGRIGLTLWPHEIDVSKDGSTAYVSNFGLRDYDLTIGYAGNSVSIIDIKNCCEMIDYIQLIRVRITGRHTGLKFHRMGNDYL